MNCKDCNKLVIPQSAYQKKLKRCLLHYREFDKLKRRRIREAKSKQTRLCPSCNISHTAPGYTNNHCLDCFRKAETKRKAKWRENNREKDRARCTRWVKANPEKVAARAKHSNQKVRAAVVNAYGSKCACPKCPEKLQEFLSIDHINGGGNEHRRKLSGRKTGGTQHLYRWLKQQGYPKDEYQLLCRNCNAGKSEHGTCPHMSV